MASDPIVLGMVVGGTAIGAIIDLRTRRVPNALTMTLAAAGVALAVTGLWGSRSPPVFTRPIPSNSTPRVGSGQALDPSRNTAIEVAGSVGVTLSVPTDPSGLTTVQSRNHRRPLRVEATSKSNSRRSLPGAAGPGPMEPSPAIRTVSPAAVVARAMSGGTPARGLKASAQAAATSATNGTWRITSRAELGEGA